MLSNQPIPFTKYHGTGNDFILIDHFKGHLKIDPQDHNTIKAMCQRHYGIGADGLIILEDHIDGEFYMNYFNADGLPGSFCGNGSRCTVAFARELGIIKHKTRFYASDGLHLAEIDPHLIFVKMQFKSSEQLDEDTWILDTGSPHFINFRNEIDQLDVYQEGKSIRYSKAYEKNGINVNFVEITSEGLNVKTYERGVEDVTLSCGSGVTAAAVAHKLKSGNNENSIYKVHTMGGTLKVKIEMKNEQVKDVWLGGPAKKVFSGFW